MKKFSLIFTLILFPAFVRAQVSNPSIIVVASAPSGACNVNLPDRQVTAAGTVYTCQSGTWGQLASGGGGSLPTATAAGQIITSTAAGTTYVAQGQIFYQQSGDTIASIETQCSSLCTYVVTEPQTITLASSHSLSANVNLYFMADGSWTVNGSGFTLTIPTKVGGTLTRHFVAGSGSVKLGPNNSLVPVEWFGAVGDWNGTTGTNNTTTIQACVTALTTSQCLGQALPYAINGTITFGSGVGFAGTKYGYYTFGNPTRIINESASANTFSAVGSSGTNFQWNKFNDFSLERSVLPTGTAAGLYTSYVGGMVVDHVQSSDSFQDFYFHGDPGDGLGIIEHSEAQWGYAGVTETAGTYCGFCVDSADGAANASIKFSYTTEGTNNLPAITTYGVDVEGEQLEDIDIDHNETAKVTQGIRFVSTGSGSNTTSDIHVTHEKDDGFYGQSSYVSGVTAAQGGSVTFSEGWADSANNGGAAAIDCESSSGVTYSNLQIGMTGGSAIGNGIIANGCSNLVISGNSFHKTSANYIELNNTNNSTVTGNSGTSPTGDGAVYGIFVTGTSAYNTVTANAISGYFSAWDIFTDTSTSNNTIVANPVDPTHATVGAIGVNGASSPQFNNNANSFRSVVDTSTDSTTHFSAYKAIGALNYWGSNADSPTSQWTLGFTTYGGTIGLNPTFAYCSSSACAEAWDINSANGVLDAINGIVTPSVNQTAASSTGGTCSMSTSTSCTITLGHTYTTPVCIITQQSVTLTGGAGGCTVSGTTVTITAAVANSETWGAFVFGNPN